MIRMVFVASILAILLIQATGHLWSASQPVSQDKITVGLADTVFIGQAKEKIVQQIKPFISIVEKESGTPCDFKVVDYKTLSDEFKSGKLDLAFTTGLELGWIKQGGAEVKPLLIVDNDPGATATVVLVPQASPMTKLEELADKKVSTDKFPFLSQFYLKTVLKKVADQYFKLQMKANADDAIEAVLEKETEGVIVTGLGWNSFQDRKPGRAKRLKVLDSSPEFPPAAFAARSNFNANQSAKFQQAMLNAAKDPEGRQVLTLYKLKGFLPLPEGYEKRVEEAAKKFPKQ